MSFEADEIVLTTRFKSWFEGAYPTIPVDYLGVKAEPVNGKIVRFRVGRAPSINSAVGGTRRRNFGTVMIQIIVPTGKGVGDLIRIGDAISARFRNFKQGSLKCRQPSFTASEDGAFVTGVVDVPFYSDYSSS